VDPEGFLYVHDNRQGTWPCTGSGYLRLEGVPTLADVFVDRIIEQQEGDGPHGD
jgi:hypothetical protein